MIQVRVRQVPRNLQKSCAKDVARESNEYRRDVRGSAAVRDPLARDRLTVGYTLERELRCLTRHGYGDSEPVTAV